MKHPADSEAPKLIAIVEDDPDVAQIIEQVLRDFAFRTVWCRSAGDLLRRLRTLSPDLCIIDLGLPDMDGVEVMQRVRAQSACGIMILTGRSHVSDRVMALELGADDYVLKPFEPRELVARVGAVLRRLERPIGGPVMVHFDLSVDLSSRETRRASELVPLTRTEFDIFATLVTQPGRVWTREQIGEQVFGQSFDALDRTIDSHMKNLRAKLGFRPDGGAYIETVRGVGYRVPRASDTV